MMKERTELTTLALSGLLDFWLGKCSGGTPPVSSTIAPADLRPWKDNIVIFEVIGDDDFVYSYYGKALADAWGHSRLGHTLDALPDEQRAILAAEYDAVLRERLPVARVYSGDFDGTRRTFERLVLPLSSDGATVDKLLVAAYELTGAATVAPTEPRVVEAAAPSASAIAPAPAATQTSGAPA
ncbi:MAG TPA: PAS domain-containing protein [Azospirillum sp.]